MPLLHFPSICMLIFFCLPFVYCCFWVNFFLHHSEITIVILQSVNGGSNQNLFVDIASRMYDWNNVSIYLKIFRLLRVLRVNYFVLLGFRLLYCINNFVNWIKLLKIIQKSEKLRFLIKAMTISTDGIWLLLYMLAIFVLLFAALVFYAEQSGEYLLNGVWYYDDGNISSA